MPERFIEWRPVAWATRDLSQHSLTDGPGGLTIVLARANECLRLDFGVVMAFRSTMEESCLEFCERFHADGPRTGAFWSVEDSEWLGSFTEADLIHYPGAVHYLIVTPDERIDVLSPRTPTVTLEA